MKLIDFINKLSFCKPIMFESKQTVKYMVDCKHPGFEMVKKLTGIVSKNFPTVGSNAFLGNGYNPDEPIALFKIYRLSLCDFDKLKDDDIDLRLKILCKELEVPEKTDSPLDKSE